MSYMKAMKAISGVLGILIVMPIWYYLLYQILLRVHASELMLFLYWIYLPVAIISQVISRIAESAAKG